ncbi:MAG: LysR family transcriptional regulator [Oscillospiraceae bacterium]
MTVQQLRYFIAVAQHLHFGEAAKACYVSQPSLSHSILELEAELNLKLLYRDNRSVELSPAGKVFYEDAQDIVRRLDEAVLKAKRADSGFEGTISVGALGGLSAGEFPAHIMNFKKKYPLIDVSITQTNMRTLNMNLLKGAMDVALTRKLDIIHRSNEIEWQTLYQDRFGIVLYRDHPLAERQRISTEELKREDFVFLSQTVTPHVYNYTIQLCANRGFVPNITHTGATLEIVCTQIKAGMGIGLLPECAMTYSSGLLRFIPLEGEDAVSDVVLAWRKRNMNPTVPTFLEEFGIDMFCR